MLDRFLGMFTTRAQRKPVVVSSANLSTEENSPEASVSVEEVYGYMFIFESHHLKKLDIEGVRAGKKNAEMQMKANHRPSGFKTTNKIYPSVEALVDEKSTKDYPHLDGSCYVLGLKYPAEKTYELIQVGKFNEAIASAENFYDCIERVSRARKITSTKSSIR